MVRNKRDEDRVVDGVTVPNGTAYLTISTGNVGYAALAPDAVTTSTIAKWLRVVDEGVEYYIPMWT